MRPGLADVGPFQADGQGQEELHRAALSLLGPEAHGHGRHKDDENPGHVGEEGVEVGLTNFQKTSEVARDRQIAAGEQEDDDEDVAERRREVALEFTPEDRDHALQLCHAATPPVRRRNTSSSLPLDDCLTRSCGVESTRMRPSLMMTARLQTFSASSSRWVDRITHRS